jgi:hypothetical protein
MVTESRDPMTPQTIVVCSSVRFNTEFQHIHVTDFSVVKNELEHFFGGFVYHGDSFGGGYSGDYVV